MDHSGLDCANYTTEGYLRPHAEVCARRRAIFCTSSHSASSRTGIDGTQCIGSCDLGISLEVFADANYASKATDRRSVSGGAIMCGGARIVPCHNNRTVVV